MRLVRDTLNPKIKIKGKFLPCGGLGVVMADEMGKRQKKKPERVKALKIRVTVEEHQALLDRCTKTSLATWMRETCLSEKRTKQSQVVEVDPALLRQLAGIGNNLNQIARVINQKAKTDTPLDRIAVIAALASIEQELKRIHNDHKIS